MSSAEAGKPGWILKTPSSVTILPREGAFTVRESADGTAGFVGDEGDQEVIETGNGLILGVTGTSNAPAPLTTSIRCETEGCSWAVHTTNPERSQALYAEHLGTDPRHTDGAWIDRRGRLRRGLTVAPDE